MNLERIRHGAVMLCFAAALGLLFLVARGNDGWSEPFGIGGVVAALAGLAYVASGLSGSEDSDPPPRGGRH